MSAPPPFVHELLRAVELPSIFECACGFPITHVGVSIHQPEPQPGDFTACPQCLAIYVLDARLDVRPVAERLIPPDYVAQRDRLLARMRRHAR